MKIRRELFKSRLRWFSLTEILGWEKGCMGGGSWLTFAALDVSTMCNSILSWCTSKFFYWNLLVRVNQGGTPRFILENQFCTHKMFLKLILYIFRLSSIFLEIKFFWAIKCKLLSTKNPKCPSQPLPNYNIFLAPIVASRGSSLSRLIRSLGRRFSSSQEFSISQLWTLEQTLTQATPETKLLQ